MRDNAHARPLQGGCEAAPKRLERLDKAGHARGVAKIPLAHNRYFAGLRPNCCMNVAAVVDWAD